MSTATMRPKMTGWTWFWGLFTGPGEAEHIGCPCRPLVMFCGAYDESPLNVQPIDGSECPECLNVWHHGACANCGCRKGQYCDLCTEEG